jgi:hypothetical protein
LISNNDSFELPERESQLKDFLEEQEKVIDFGTTEVYRKFSCGENISRLSSKRDLTKSPGPIGSDELDYLFDMLKQKYNEQNIGKFLLQSYVVLVETMKFLLGEMNLMSRFVKQISKLE